MMFAQRLSMIQGSSRKQVRRGHRGGWSGDTGEAGAGTQVRLERGHR